MFLQVSVCPQEGRCTPPKQTPPWAGTPPRWPLQRTVLILLECILVLIVCILNSRSDICSRRLKQWWFLKFSDQNLGNGHEINSFFGQQTPFIRCCTTITGIFNCIRMSLEKLLINFNQYGWLKNS